MIEIIGEIRDATPEEIEKFQNEWQKRERLDKSGQQDALREGACGLKEA